MASPTPPTLSSFRALPGGQSQAIAASDGHLVTLNANSAAWWEGDVVVTARLPGVPVDGARWTADGAGLLVGPGRLDIATRAWSPDPSFATLVRPGPDAPTLRAVAWAADGTHAAVLLDPAPPSPGARRPASVVEIRRMPGVRARIEAPTARAVAFVADRLAVGAEGVRLYDLDGALVGEAAVGKVARLRTDGRTLAALGVDGRVALLDGASGALLARWDQVFVDVAVQGSRVVGVDLAGVATVACWEAGRVEAVTSIATGTAAPVVAIDGSSVIVAGRDGVRVGALTGECAALG